MFCLSVKNLCLIEIFMSRHASDSGAGGAGPEERRSQVAMIEAVHVSVCARLPWCGAL